MRERWLREGAERRVGCGASRTSRRMEWRALLVWQRWWWLVSRRRERVEEVWGEAEERATLSQQLGSTQRWTRVSAARRAGSVVVVEPSLSVLESGPARARTGRDVRRQDESETETERAGAEPAAVLLLLDVLAMR